MRERDPDSEDMEESDSVGDCQVPAHCGGKSTKQCHENYWSIMGQEADRTLHLASWLSSHPISSPWDDATHIWGGGNPGCLYKEQSGSGLLDFKPIEIGEIFLWSV